MRITIGGITVNMSIKLLCNSPFCNFRSVFTAVKVQEEHDKIPYNRLQVQRYCTSKEVEHELWTQQIIKTVCKTRASRPREDKENIKTALSTLS